MEISAVELKCPVTAVAVLPPLHAEPELLLVGAGPVLRVHALGGQNGDTALCSTEVFASERIHGFRLVMIESKRRVLVFGTFSAVVMSVEYSSASGKVECHRALELSSIPPDMILDGISTDWHLILGHGQNFLSVYDLSSGERRGAARSSMICVLFSLCFGNRRAGGSIPVASGSAMGDIYLWGFDPASPGSAVIAPAVTLRGHEGVVCKMCWSSDNSRLASVSDDRSVRLFDAVTGSTLFTGWGHACRVWDVAFRGERERELITCGEDLCLKLWDPEAERCLCTMEGHVGRNAWCIAYSAAQDCVISGGNDSSVKVWAVDTHLSLSPEQPSAARGAALAVDMSGLLRGDAASALRLSADATSLYVVTQQGRIVAAGLEHSEQSSRGHLFSGLGRVDEMALNTASPVHTADICTAERGVAYVFCGHVDGSATVAITADGTLRGSHTWKAHKWRTIGLWILDVCGEGLLGITATVAGELKLWKVGFASADSSAISALSCICEMTTRKQIASCAHRISALGSASLAGGVLVGGCKGAVCLYSAASCLPADPADAAVQPTFSVAHVHGTEKVCSFREISDGFVSCGNNGGICVHKFTEDAFITCTNLDPGLLNCCESVFFTGNTADCCDFPSAPVFACGFQGSVFRIWDVRGKYELMRVEAGSWKRMHDSVVVPSESGGARHPEVACFVSLDSTGSAPLLHVHSVRTAPSSPGLPLYFGQSSNGRVMYSGVIIGGARRCLAAGGEEGVVKLFTLPGMAVAQEVRLPEDCPVRTLCACPAPGAGGQTGILVAAGGRLSFAVWTYALYSAVGAAAEDRLPSLAPALLFAAAGDPPKNATQEHRILSSACWSSAADSAAIYCILLCDSRGCARLFRYSTMAPKLKLAWEVEVSEFPLLSCVVLPFGSAETTLVCFGDTSGYIYLYSISRAHHIREGEGDPEGLRLVGRYRGHSMGANAADMMLLSAPPSVGDGTQSRGRVVICSGGDDQAMALATVEFGVDGFSEARILGVEVIDGVCGSALKGVSLISTSSGVYAAGVGLDQRLSIWRCAGTALPGAPADTAVTAVESQPAALDIPIVRTLAHQEGCPVSWVSGRAVAVADVACMDLCEERSAETNADSGTMLCAVVGEGIELLRINIQRWL